jgi:hypothetical protein
MTVMVRLIVVSEATRAERKREVRMMAERVLEQ